MSNASPTSPSNASPSTGAGGNSSAYLPKLYATVMPRYLKLRQRLHRTDTSG